MPKDEQFAEEWIWDHYAYLSAISDKVYVFDIADPAHPQSADPLKVDARLVNDVASQADRFNDVVPKYRANPDLFVQQRLSETLGRVLPNVRDKIFLTEGADGKSKELRLLLNREPPKAKTEETK